MVRYDGGDGAHASGSERELVLRVHGAEEWVANIEAGLRGVLPPLLLHRD